MSQVFKVDNSSAARDIETITGNSGGAVGPDAAFNVNLLGSGGATVTGSPGTNTLTIAVTGSGFAWNAVAGTAGALTVGNGYVTQNVGLTSFSLPVTAAFGTSTAICGFGAGGWLISQGAGQSVIIGGVSSTVGALGVTASTNRYDSVELLCVVANTTWVATNVMGTLSVV